MFLAPLAARRAVVCFAGEAESMLRGMLVAGTPPAIETADHRHISVTGDKATQGILNDKRVQGMELEVKGHFSGADAFTIGPIENRSMIAFKDGKRYRITYYCDVCSIRTYTPGPCVCCQQNTRLDLLDPSQE